MNYTKKEYCNMVDGKHPDFATIVAERVILQRNSGTIWGVVVEKISDESLWEIAWRDIDVDDLDVWGFGPEPDFYMTQIFPATK